MPESEVDEVSGMARCLACGTTFSRYAGPGDASESRLPAPESASSGVTFRYLESAVVSGPGSYRERSGGRARAEGVDVVISMSGGGRFVFLFFLAIALPMIYCSAGFFLELIAHVIGSERLAAVAPYAWIPLAVLAIYAALAAALRHPRLRLDARGLRVRTSRLPLWGDRSFALASLHDIFPSTWEEVIQDKSGDEIGRVTRYAMYAALDGGRRKRLVVLDERALFVGSLLGEMLRELKS